MVAEIVGRNEELPVLRAYFDRSIDRSAALVLEGEVGIGKSTLWRAAVAEASARGFRVLSSSPAEAERGLAFAGLGDLLEPVLDEVLPLLPPPRRRALQTVLLLEEAEDPVDPRALGVAVRTALELLGSEGPPLVLAVDDVQWLDPSSEDALAFAMRRLETPLVLLLARRIAEGIGPSQLEQVLDGDAVERLGVGPLTLGAIQRLLRERLDRAFARPTLLRIHEASGGNPFYALEFARGLRDEVDATKPLPVPETLEELVSARLAGLPKATRRALALAAAVGSPTLELLRAAGVDDAALEPAFAGHVIEPRDGALRFTHPLLASVLYQGMTVEGRRHSHRRAAEVVADPIERARHLALSTERADDETAAAIEAAADLATARGAIAAAGALHEHALRLTPPEQDEHVERRATAAARARMTMGDVARARALADLVLEQAPPGPRRAHALVLASDLAISGNESVRLRRDALAEAGDDLALQARIHHYLGWNVRFLEGLEAAERHARESLELAERIDDDALRAACLATLSATRLHLGSPDALRLGKDAYELACLAADAELLIVVTLWFSSTLIWTTHLDRARALLEPLLHESSERDEMNAAHALWRLAFVELAQGRLGPAADYARQARDINRLYSGADDPALIWAVALIDAYRGDLDSARELAEQGRAIAEETNPWFAAYLEGVHGLAVLWSGDARAAVERFSAAEEGRSEVGSREPNLARWRAEYAEALLELGRVDDAEALVESWEAEGARLGRTAVVAQATRCRGLAAAARGDIDRALGLLEEAALLHEGVGDALGRARALLALGVVRRRSRQKRAAREAIEEAVAAFEECGAALFAERARAELGRIGGRTRAEGLTPAEQRVAELVAEGRTNREVAAALMLGERTVETHLSHVYAKLGVRSRTELARVYEPAS